jgi:hypothetical protein
MTFFPLGLALGAADCVDEALEQLRLMQSEGLKPRAAVYLLVLDYLSGASKEPLTDDHRNESSTLAGSSWLQVRAPCADRCMDIDALSAQRRCVCLLTRVQRCRLTLSRTLNNPSPVGLELTGTVSGPRP